MEYANLLESLPYIALIILLLIVVNAILQVVNAKGS